MHLGGKYEDDMNKIRFVPGGRGSGDQKNKFFCLVHLGMLSMEGERWGQ